MDENSTTILSVPLEILELILSYPEITTKDVLSFSQTCTTFRSITECHGLWMRKICNEWPDLKHFTKMKISWFEEYQHMMKTHIFCQNRIKKLSATYYWSKLSLSDIHLGEFLEKSQLYNGLAYYYIIGFMKKNCSNPTIILDAQPSKELYNLTNQYYSTIILDYLSQNHLRVLWGTLFVNATPEKVAIFFDQWIEPKCDNSSTTVANRLSMLIDRVEALLPKTHPLLSVEKSKRLEWEENLLPDNQFDPATCRHLIKLVCEVLTEDVLLTDDEPTSSSLLIYNVIDLNKSNKILSSIFFEAVARRCGIRCDVIFFPNHRFLLWRESWIQKSPTLIIDLKTASTKVPSRCPFSAQFSNVSEIALYSYSPISILVNLATYMKEVSEFKKRSFKNAVELLTFLEPNNVGHICFLSDIYLDLKKDTEPIRQRLCRICENDSSMGYHSDRAIHTTISRINWANMDRAENPISEKVIKQRTVNIKYAVGMICYHKMYGYICVVRGWDNTCNATPEWKMNMGINQLRYGEKQPFYHVLAIDFTERYVAEENLIMIYTPQRLFYIEERLAFEFSHFNGYFYIPNTEKDEEYPQDWQIRAVYKNKMQSHYD